MHWTTRLLRVTGLVLVLASVSFCQQDAPKDAPKDAPNTGSGEGPTSPYAPLQLGEGDPAKPVAEPIPASPDTRPLSGVLGLTLGSLKGRRSVVSIGFQAAQVFDSNPGVLGSGSDYEGATSFRANLNLRHPMRRGDLNLDYQAGAVIYSGGTAVNWFPQVNFSVPFALRRWTITLAESVTYSPESTSGAGLGFTDFGAGSLGLGGIGAGFSPSQSVYTPLSSRLSNTSAAQVQYLLSPRSSWTAGVSYGSLYYPDGNLDTTRQINVRSGYNRALTAKDTVAVIYEYGAYSQTGLGTEVETHSAELAYARRVTGRLTLAVSGGPQIATGALATDDTRVTWTASSSAQYQLRGTSFGLSYLHGVSGGSGVLPGATTDTLQAGITRMLTRTLTLGTSGTLSKTSALAGNTEFRSGGAGVQVQRSLGRRAGVYFSYAFQRQISDGSCIGVLCAGLSRQVFGFGLNWSPGSWVIR